MEEPTRTIDAESELVRQAKDGNAEAFERLYRLEVGHVYALCLRMTADPVRAQRLTQDAFVKAWKALPDFRGASKFSTWIHRIAVNAVLVDQRGNRRRRLRLWTTDTVQDVDLRRSSPDADVRMDLEKAIAALPDRARAVIILHDVHGYRHDEIGELLDIATGTSKAHLHRARELLRDLLER